MENSYSVFAKFYDILTENIDYKKRALYFSSLIEKFSELKSRTILDLACGTASLTNELSRLDFDCIGLDISQDMLEIAKNKLGQEAKLILGDMQNFTIDKEVDVVIAALDSINHIPSSKGVESCFKSVHNALNAGGLFLFDVNTCHKHKNILADNSFVFDRDEVYLVWDNHFLGNKTQITLDFFVPSESERGYKRYCEQFEEYIYSEEKIIKMLEKTGFEACAIYDDDSFSKGTETSERLVFVAKKNR